MAAVVAMGPDIDELHKKKTYEENTKISQSKAAQQLSRKMGFDPDPRVRRTELDHRRGKGITDMSNRKTKRTPPRNETKQSSNKTTQQERPSASQIATFKSSKPKKESPSRRMTPGIKRNPDSNRGNNPLIPPPMMPGGKKKRKSRRKSKKRHSRKHKKRSLKHKRRSRKHKRHSRKHKRHSRKHKR